VVGDAVLGAEVRAGVLHYTWLSPVPLTSVVFARWVAGWLISLATVVPACAVAALIAGVPRGVGPIVISAGAAAAAYIGLFVMIGCITRRAAMWSLAAVLLVEDLLGAALAGIAQLSPAWEGRAAYAKLGPLAEDIARTGIPTGWGAVVRLGVITVVTLAIAAWRLRHLRLTGPED
jgi:hypothetical protein